MGKRPARFLPPVGFGFLVLVGLAMAAFAAGCRSTPAGPEEPVATQTDPAQAEEVDPERPMNEPGEEPESPALTRPTPQPDPQPLPGRDPAPDRLPEPNPVPNPAPSPNPTPPG